MGHFGFIAFSILLVMQSAFAGSVSLTERDLGNSKAPTKWVSELKPGDVVRLKYNDGKEHIFHLGASLGEGKMGRVFRLENGATPPQVVKFQKGGEKAKKFMEDEVTAMKWLKHDHIAHSEMREWDARLFVTKDYVEGKTLKALIPEWKKIPPPRRVKLANGLYDLLESLALGGTHYSDIKEDNIILDEINDVWKVIDPGTAFEKRSSYRQLERVMEYISKQSPQLEKELQLVQQDPKYLTQFLEYQDTIDLGKPSQSKNCVHNFLRKSFSWSMRWRQPK